MLSRCFLDFSVGVGDFVIELSHISSFFIFWWLFVLSLFPFDIFVSMRAFVTGLSQISSFFSPALFLVLMRF